MDIKLNLIKVGERYRSDMGDIQALADSIKELGQLQPIGVDSNYRLIFGQRRIKACELLGLDTVKGNVINLKDALKGEWAENEIRKDFTISECVEIGKAIELELGERRGGDTSINEQSKREKLPVCKENRTRDIAAEKSGLGSGKTFESAKKVTETGSPKLVEKMDNKEVSISAAAKIADMDKADQEEVIEEIESGTKPAQAIKTKEEILEEGKKELEKNIKVFCTKREKVSATEIEKEFNVPPSYAKSIIQTIAKDDKNFKYEGNFVGEIYELSLIKKKGQQKAESEPEPKSTAINIEKYYEPAKQYLIKTQDADFTKFFNYLKVSPEIALELFEELEFNGVISAKNDDNSRNVNIPNLNPEQEFKKNEDLEEELYYKVTGYPFAYPDFNADLISRYYKISIEKAEAFIKRMEDEKVISEINEEGNRTLGTRPARPEIKRLNLDFNGDIDFSTKKDKGTFYGDFSKSDLLKIIEIMN